MPNYRVLGVESCFSRKLGIGSSAVVTRQKSRLRQQAYRKRERLKIELKIKEQGQIELVKGCENLKIERIGQ